MPALVVLAALLASGAIAATSPSVARDTASSDVVSLAEGVEVAALPEAPAGDSTEEPASVDARVTAELERKGSVAVVIRLREQADLAAVAADARARGRAHGRKARVAAVVESLRATAERSQAGVRGLLRAEEAAGRARDVRSFWVFNGLAATVGRGTLERLAAHPDVASVTLDAVLTAPEVEPSPRFPTWGLEKVNAPKTWGDYGFTGEGVVVGVMDTGVDGGHPALASRYRGRNGDHASSWFVPTGENYPTPGDGHGHGTHVTGSILGGPPGEVVGVAPDAQWIAAKIFRDSGSTTTSIIHAAFEWMLAPGGDPAKAPHVVNNSWGSTATYSTEFLPDVRAWVAAGIFPAFANGNSGPGSGTVGSPGSFPESFGVGATDVNDFVASFSSRGPAVWDGVAHVKPQVSAPGHQIYSAWPRQLGRDYHTISGTSMATPHLSGVVALLLSAAPGLSVDAVRDLLTSTARREPHMGRLPNNDYGHGIADAFAAVTAARFSGTLLGTVAGPDGPLAGARVTVPELGLSAETDAAGTYELRVKEGTWQVRVAAYGYVSATASVTVRARTTAERSFRLERAPAHTLSGVVTAGGRPLAGARVRVAGTPLEPAYTAADGSFSLTVAAGTYEARADATGYSRAARTVEVAGDTSVSFALEALPGAVEPGWREYQNNAARTGLSAEELAAGALTRAWSVKNSGQIMFASPAVANGRVYVAHTTGLLRALDLDDGSLLWSFASGANFRTTPAVADGRVYVAGGDSGVFHALDAATGAPIWSHSTGDRLTYAAPTVVDGTVYFGTGWGTANGGWVYALDAATGALRWKSFVGAQVYFAPAVGGGRVFAASYDARRLVALDAATGEELWAHTRTTDSFAAMPSYDDGRVYVATNNFDTGAGSVLALDAETGRKLWEATGHGDAAGNTPVLFGDLVIAGSSANNWVVAYDRATGARRWVYSVGAAVSNSQLAADGVLVGGSQQDRRVWALDAYSGRLLWEDAMTDNVLSAPAFADGRLVVADRSGTVRAYEAPGTVAGTVTDASGAPLAAQVRVRATGVSVSTDPSTGAFELPHRPGTYTLDAVAYGYVAASAELTIRSGQRIARSFRLAPAAAGSVRGSVVDEAGTPLAGARVELEGTTLAPATTDAAGAFAFDAVAEGTYRLVASLSGYATLREDVRVAAGAETTVAATLLRYQIAVTGDRDGAVTQYLRGKGFRVESTTAAAIAEHPGAYELVVANGAQDDPGQETFLRLVANADAAETSVIFLDSWGLSYGALWHLIKYTGDPSQRVSGYNEGEVSLVARVAHPLTDGLAVGERVPALATNKEWAAFAGYSGRSVADVFVGRSGGTVGSGIGYQPRTLGSVHVLLSLHAASPWTGPYSGWTAAGARVFDNAVTYALGASFGAVEGTVTSTSGQPLAARVTAVGSGDTATAGADGRYRLLLPPGTHTLRFERIGHVPQEVTVTLAARTTETVDAALASSGAGAITGRVTNAADGAPVAGAEVRVVGTPLEPATTGADGRFAIDGVPGGTYDVQVTAPRFRSFTVRVTVQDGAATDVSVRLRAALRVAVVGDFLTGGENKLTKLLVQNEIAATATQWEAFADLDAYDVVVVNSPADPGAAAFRGYLDALDAAGKSAIFLHGPFSTSGGVRLLRTHVGDPAGAHGSVGSTTSGDRFFRPLGAGHPIFEGVPRTPSGDVHVLASGRAAGYFQGYSGIQLGRFGVGSTELGEGVAYEPRTPTSVRLLLSALAATSSAHPELGWTEPGKKLLLNAIEWAASPGLGTAAGRVVDADGDAVTTARVRIVETNRRTQVDGDGGFAIPHPPGEFTLEVSAYGYATRQVPVRVEAGRATQLELELALGNVGTVAGTVRARGSISGASGEGPPVAGAQVQLLGVPRTTTTADDGTYRLPHVEPGTYQLQIDAAGHVRQVHEVVVAAGSTTTRDAVLRPSPRVAVIDDCQQTANCVDKMQRYLREWGYVAAEIVWADHERLGEFDLVVANLGDFPRLDPGAEGLAAFQDSANRAHVPVIWLEQYQRGSIRWLSHYEGDPLTVHEGRSQGLVEAEIQAAHPLVEGFAVGERVPIVSGGSAEHTWFNGYSGTTVAGLRTATGGLKGGAIAYKGRTASSVEVLFSSFAASFYTWPPVGGAPAQLLTPQALRLFHNALNWALDAPALAAEARGVVRSSAGGALPATVTVVETGKRYAAREGDGTFLVPLQPGTWTLRVEAFGHAPATSTVTVAAGDVRQLTVTLQSNEVGTLHGTIGDPAGSPVEGAVVSLERTPLEASTSASGSYRIERIPVGTYRMTVRKDGFAIARRDVTIAAGATTRQDVRLEASRPVAVAGDYQGTLSAFLAENGYAVRQWSWTNVHQHIPELDEVDLVVLNGSGSAPSAANLTAFVQAAADADRPLVLAGQFGMGSIRAFRNTFGDPQSFTQGFVATATYYRPTVEHPIFDGFPVGQPIEIARNTAPGGNQQYEYFGGYSGQTIATLGSATSTLGAGVAYRFATPTSVHVLLGSLGATGTYGYPGERWTANALRIYLNAVDWAMDAAQAQLQGTVTSGGKPVGGATVRAVEAGFSARTLVDGTYRLGVTAGTHTIRVTADGYEPFEGTVEVGSQGSFRFDVELVAIPRGSVTGTVRDAATGAPLAGAAVTLAGARDAETLTDAAGAFAFEDVVPETYAVTVRADGYLAKTLSATVRPGETTQLAFELRSNDVAVLGDWEGTLARFLRGRGMAATELRWADAAAEAPRYDVVVVNGGTPSAEEFEAFVAAADAAGTSLVFTGTWGVANGGIRLLERHRPAEVAVGGHGYRDGEVTLTGFAGDHPLFAGLDAPFRPVARDGYYSFLERYVGPYLANLAVAGEERGVGAAYDFRSAGSVHVLLPAGAATGLIGPGYGWTAAGEKLLLNAIAWAKDAEQEPPAAPELATDSPPLVTAAAATLTGTAEFRSTVTIRRGGDAVATAAPARDGTFSVEVELVEGPNAFTAVATNHGGTSPASATVTIVRDTTAPTLTWSPADGTGFFERQLVVSGRAADAHAGVAEVTVNGAPASLTADGGFAAEVTLAPGTNELTVVARDRAGNVASETRRVAYYPYSTRWTVGGGQGQGELNVFLDITDAAGAAVRATDVRAELVRPDGSVEAAQTMQFADGRYRANLGRPPAGTYALRAIVRLDAFTVRSAGPQVVRAALPAPGR
ncbi:MAG TPA: carboxypeptidase regulatory-like domain-containing protein [Gaiellaceae bacterium]|nr:carboxypeptidase regulatory-like domain-containing protein [Gaiellaceae bacterium]